MDKVYILTQGLPDSYSILGAFLSLEDAKSGLANLFKYHGHTKPLKWEGNAAYLFYSTDGESISLRRYEVIEALISRPTLPRNTG
jgi:hypothetical protein